MPQTYAPIDLGAIAAGDGGFVIHGAAAGDYAGFAVSNAGDINGDGFDDMLIGAPRVDSVEKPAPDSGGAWVVFGGPKAPTGPLDLAALPAGAGFALLGDAAWRDVGGSVAFTGDLNGDGIDDLVLGAFQSAPGGRAAVLFGRADGLDPVVPLTDLAGGNGGFVLAGEELYGALGFDVASAGDLNGDGFDDLAVADPSRNGAGGTFDTGTVYVLFGGGGLPTATADPETVGNSLPGLLIRGESLFDSAGLALGSAGDVNGDGFDDLILGVPYGQGAGPYEGSAYVVFGGTALPTEIRLADLRDGTGGFRILGESPYDASGRPVAGGDINGDGFDDILYGAFNADAQGKEGAGAVYVVFGKGTPFAPTVELAKVATGDGGFVLRGTQPFDQIGQIGPAGDVNGDGFDDLLIGARDAGSAGEVYLVFGRAEGLQGEVDLEAIRQGQGGLLIAGEDAGDGAGSDAAATGDVNGDGFADLLIGAWKADGPGESRPDAGAAYVVFGGGFQPGPAFTDGDDDLRGGAGAQFVQGGAGRDTLRGAAGDDTVAGGAGNDLIVGNGGADVLSGGAGADRFVFGRFALGDVDRILDFDAAEGDGIRLALIDADTATPGDDAFTAIGTAAFSGTAGELRWQDRGGGVQRIEGDVDGDGAADLVIDVVDAAPVQAGWFVL